MSSTETSPRGRILGIGGIFFKSNDAADLRSWYQNKLGMKNGPEGAIFQWRDSEAPEREYMTVWSVFPADSKYFGPSGAQFMINYIVDDLEAFLAKLRDAGVQIDPKQDDHEYGRFAWIYDPNGVKIELWEPPVSGA
jgi:catechol 2,3-dioxygenase-like lactoylglutathione lyase family enzyme